MERTAVELWPDGAYKVTREPLASVDTVLRRVASQAPLRIQNAFQVNGRPVTLAVSDQAAYAAVQIPGLKLRTFFETSDVVLPTFNHDDITALNRTISWTVPERMKLYFGFVARTDRVVGWRGTTYLLFAKSTDPEQAGFFRLPLPNVYEDGRLCMGNGLSFPGTLKEIMEKCLVHLDESSWNTDMWSADVQARCNKLFRFDKSTLVTLPPTEKWESVCRRVSRVEMEALYPNGS